MLLDDSASSEAKTPAGKTNAFQTAQKAARSFTKTSVLPGLPEKPQQTPLKMDKKKHGQLKRGKVQPEGRIDLHGMTLAQAQPALTEFILSAHARNKRLVLVITGKGKNSDDGGPIPVRYGVLRHAVPVWLSVSPLASVVLQVTQAHTKHGGGGAYYVYLRRNR